MKSARIFISLLLASFTAAQEAAPPAKSAPTPLAILVEEAERTNPEMAAAEHGWRAATYEVRQASALPDTEIQVQQFAVGSPRPFAGFSNSDFAYLGVGAAQEFPFPGKRGLRGQVAGREADAQREQAQSVRRGVVERLKSVYFRLAYRQEERGILERDDRVLADVEKVVESRYRVGQGNQQDVLKAQLQHTRILQLLAGNTRAMGELQAELRRLLNRPPEAAEVVAEPLAARPIPYTQAQLLEFARQQNPDVRAQEQMLRKAETQVKLAGRESRPDFSLGYMWQHTADNFRDYYMLTLGLRLPNRGRTSALLAEAVQKRDQARQQLAAEVNQRLAEVQSDYVAVNTTAEQLRIFREGLIPQAEATFRAGMAAYESGRQDFETLFASFLDLLNLEIEYQQQLAEHETALARLEARTGVTLP